MSRLACLCFSLLALLLPAVTLAQTLPNPEDLPTGPRPSSWHLYNAMAVGLNGPVFGDLFKFYRKMPWGEGKTLLTSDSHWRVGTHDVVSPAYARPAILIGVSPLLIMDLDVHYGPGISFTYEKYKSVYANYDPQNLGDPDGYMKIFHQAQANLVLKAAVGPVAVLHFDDLDYFYCDEPIFLWEVATVVKDGFFLRDKTYVLIEFQPNWRLLLDYENFEYYKSDYKTELLASGIVIQNPAIHNLTMIVQLGYHLRNPDFKGLKIWSAAQMEWDFPDKKK